MVNQPIKKFKAGAISVSIWENERDIKGEKVVFRTVLIDRRYMDKDDTWKSTNSMRISDVPKAILVLQKAYEYLTLQEYQESTIIGKEPEEPTDEVAI